MSKAMRSLTGPCSNHAPALKRYRFYVLGGSSALNSFASFFSCSYHLCDQSPKRVGGNGDTDHSDCRWTSATDPLQPPLSTRLGWRPPMLRVHWNCLTRRSTSRGPTKKCTMCQINGPSALLDVATS